VGLDDKFNNIDISSNTKINTRVISVSRLLPPFTRSTKLSRHAVQSTCRGSDSIADNNINKKKSNKIKTEAAAAIQISKLG